MSSQGSYCEISLGTMVQVCLLDGLSSVGIYKLAIDRYNIGYKSEERFRECWEAVLTHLSYKGLREEN
jgi:hypothetical protein